MFPQKIYFHSYSFEKHIFKLTLSKNKFSNWHLKITSSKNTFLKNTFSKLHFQKIHFQSYSIKKYIFKTSLSKQIQFQKNNIFKTTFSINTNLPALIYSSSVPSESSGKFSLLSIICIIIFFSMYLHSFNNACG